MQLLSRFLQSAAIHSFVTKFSRTKNLTIKGTIIQKSALYPRFNKTPLLIGCRLSCVLHFSKRSTFSVSVREKVILSQRSKSMVLMILCLILCYNRNDSWIQILWESYFSCSPNFPSIRLDEVRETIHHFLITPGKLRISRKLSDQQSCFITFSQLRTSPEWRSWKPGKNIATRWRMKRFSFCRG